MVELRSRTIMAVELRQALVGRPWRIGRCRGAGRAGGRMGEAASGATELALTGGDRWFATRPRRQPAPRQGHTGRAPDMAVGADPVLTNVISTTTIICDINMLN